MKRLLAVLGIISVAALCLGTWWYQTSRVLDLVQVHASRPVCGGTSLEGDHTIRAQRGMACTVTVTVANRSARTVHVRQVELPNFGSQSQWVIQPGPSTAGRIEDRGTDAVLPIDADLDSGDLLQFGLELAYRESGCTGGDPARLRPWPEVSVAFLGRSETRDGNGELRFVQVGPSRGCPSG